MRTAGKSAYKHGTTLKEWLAFFFLALALHVLLFSLFRPLPAAVSESSRESRYTIFMEEKELSAQRNDPYGLQYWLRYTDPARLLKPDFEYGFSRICGKNEITVPDPANFHSPLFKPLIYNWIPSKSDFPERTPADFAGGSETAVIPPPVSSPAPMENQQYPVWTDENGRITSGLFLADDNSVDLLKRQRASRPTVLRLILREGRFPSVDLLRSCGNPKLDMLAMRQLKLRKENFEPAALRGEKYFTVFWQMPELDSIRKEKQP